MIQLIVNFVVGGVFGFLGAMLGIWVERRHQSRAQLARVWRRPFGH